MINWFTLIKKLMQTYIVIVSGNILNVSTVHLNGIWHLIWHYLSKPVLGGHPVLSGHYSIPRGCLLNKSFTVFKIRAKNFLKINWSMKTPWHERMEVVHTGLWALGIVLYRRFSVSATRSSLTDRYLTSVYVLLILCIFSRGLTKIRNRR